jgi:hypothetical protein
MYENKGIETVLTVLTMPAAEASSVQTSSMQVVQAKVVQARPRAIPVA